MNKTKISSRFFNDREVRAIWDEENSKWWYSVPDIIGVLNEQDDYTRNRNYWKYLADFGDDHPGISAITTHLS